MKDWIMVREDPLDSRMVMFDVGDMTASMSVDEAESLATHIFNVCQDIRRQMLAEEAGNDQLRWEEWTQNA